MGRKGFWVRPLWAVKLANIENSLLSYDSIWFIRTWLRLKVWLYMTLGRVSFFVLFLWHSLGFSNMAVGFVYTNDILHFYIREFCLISRNPVRGPWGILKWSQIYFSASEPTQTLCIVAMMTITCDILSYYPTYRHWGLAYIDPFL